MQSVYPNSTTRGCPLRRSSNIIEGGLRRNEEAPFPQARRALSSRVLRKKHARLGGPGTISSPQSDSGGNAKYYCSKSIRYKYQRQTFERQIKPSGCIIIVRNRSN